MTKTIARTYKYTNEFRSYITYVLAGVCAIFAFAYVFNVYSVISHSVSLQDIEDRTSSLSEIVQDLDARYIGLSNRITPDLVRSRGMSEGTVTSYISRTVYLGVVSLSGYEL